jgi:hypothetical protein
MHIWRDSLPVVMFMWAGVTIQVPIILLRYEATADNEVQQSNKFVSKITIIIATRGGS